MAGISEQVLAAMSVRIGADTKDLVSGFKKARTETDLITSQMKKMGALIAGAFTVGAVVNFAKESVNAYNQQAQAEAKLLTALNGRKDVQERLIRQAGALQWKSLYGDEQIVEAQARLTMMLGGNEAAVRKLIPAIIDLAAAKGMDLVQAADLVSKSIASSTNSLGRYGIQIEGAAGSSERLESALTSLNEKFKGQAETVANAGVNSIEQMKKAWGEMQEQMGKWAAPGVTEFATRSAKQFRVWGSEDFSFWQKLGMAFNKKRLDEMVAIIELNETMQQQMDEFAVKKDENLNLEAKEIPLLQAAREKLEEYKTAWEAAITEEQLALYGRKLQLQEEEIKRLQELGRLTKEQEKQAILKSLNLEGMTPMQGIGMEDAQIETTPTSEPITQSLSAFNDEALKTIDITNELKQSFESTAVSFGEMMGNLISGSESFDGSQLLGTIASIMKQFGELAISAGITALAIKASLKLKNPYVAIAAGVALVALAAAVQNAANNISNGGGGGSVGSMQDVTGGGTNGNYYSREMGEGYKAIEVHVKGEIAGDKIKLVTDRSQNNILKF